MRRRPGSRYTWSKNRGGPAHTRSRLDRAFSNEGWVQLFPDSSVRNLPRTYSDHSPLLVCLECSQNKQLRLDFLFKLNLSEVILGLFIAIFLLFIFLRKEETRILAITSSSDFTSSWDVSADSFCCKPSSAYAMIGRTLFNRP